MGSKLYWVGHSFKAAAISIVLIPHPDPPPAHHHDQQDDKTCSCPGPPHIYCPNDGAHPLSDILTRTTTPPYILQHKSFCTICLLPLSLNLTMRIWLLGYRPDQHKSTNCMNKYEIRP